MSGSTIYWTTFAIAVALVVGAALFVGWSWLAAAKRKPELSELQREWFDEISVGSDPEDWRWPTIPPVGREES